MSLARELPAELTAACRADPRAAEVLAAELTPYLPHANGDGAAEWLDRKAAAATRVCTR